MPEACLRGASSCSENATVLHSSHDRVPRHCRAGPNPRRDPMTTPGTEVVRKLFETAFTRGLQGLKRYLHPEVRILEAESPAYGGAPGVGVDARWLR